jgi:hypothetical protein
LSDSICDGLMQGKRTFHFMERCDCKAKYKITQESGPLLRHVCGRHALTFRAGIRQGRRYIIENLTT